MSLPNIQDNNQQILNDIQSLQNIEQDLFNNLETNTNLTSTQQEEIIDKINQISKMRINLYQTLSGVNNYFQNALTNSQGTLQEQSSAIDIVENELNQAKKKLAILEEQKNNKIRLVEINNYYGDKYAEHTTLMKYIIFMLVPIIIISILFNKNLIPKPLYYILLFIISIIGVYFIVLRILSIWSRDNMNYQEYAWGFDIKSAPTGSPSTTDPWLKTTSMDNCVTQAINSAQSSINEQANQTASVALETFVNNVFTKQSQVTKKPDVILNSIVNASNSSSYGNYEHY
jgi:hypothetical protein